VRAFLARPWLPLLLLVALLWLHLSLAHRAHAMRGFAPRPLIHDGAALVLDLEHTIAGWQPQDRSPHINMDQRRFYFGDREPIRWIHPGQALGALSTGPLQGFFSDHQATGVDRYWSAVPHAFFWPAVLGSLLPGHATTALGPQLFLGLLLIASFALGWRLRDPWVGLVSAALVSGFPAAFDLARTHHDALPHAAWLLALATALLASRGYRRLLPCLLAGLVSWELLRTGESISSTAIAALAAGPLLLGAGVEALRGERHRRQWAGLALCLLPPALALDPRRLLQLGERLSAPVAATGPQVAGPASPDPSVLEPFSYPIVIALDLVGPWPSLLVLLGLALLVRARAWRLLPLLLAVALPMALLSLAGNKARWYVAPLAPLLAPLAVLGLAQLKQPLLRRGLLALAAATGLAALVILSEVRPLRGLLDPLALSERAHRTLPIRTRDSTPLPGQPPPAYAPIRGPLQNHLATLRPAPGREAIVVGLVDTAFDRTPINSLRYQLHHADRRVLGVQLGPYAFRHQDLSGIERLDLLVLLMDAQGSGESAELICGEGWDASLGLLQDQEHMAALWARICARDWERVELSSGPVYRAVER
jgi:hypothetical protein